MYDDRPEALSDLLTALFHRHEELERFLVLADVPLTPVPGLATETRNRPRLRLIATALVDQGLAGEAFFAALRRRTPERAADIDSVAARFRAADSPPAGPHPGTGRHSDFTARLAASLAALDPPGEAERSVSAEHWPWTAVAAVLGSFDPFALRPLPGEPAPALSAVAALSDFVTTDQAGRWVLDPEPRTAALRQLSADGTLSAALRANQDLPDRHRDLLQRLREGQAPALPLLSRSELVDLDAVLGWLEPVTADLPVSRQGVHATAERRLLIDPLRSLVGSHFRGRARELGWLEDHIHGRAPQWALLLQGVGGSGKSTLLGHVILELEQRALHEPVSFVYLDFDKIRYDPRDTVGLLRQLTQQVRLLHATSASASRFAALESFYDATDVDHAAELLAIDADADPTALVDTLLDILIEQLREVQGTGPAGTLPPLLLFLDTFEEVLTRGPGAVWTLTTWLGRLRQRLPDMRVVIAGRRVPAELLDGSNHRELSDLDPVAADAVLGHLGVTQPQVRELIVENLGGNPLTLRLAAEAVRRAGETTTAGDDGGAGDIFADVVPRAGVLADAALEEVQGMLYSRVLGHIRDPEVAAVAHPGLVVRRVDADVLREVLATPCGLDPGRAEQIFTKLIREVTLFDPEPDGSLRHRQDVRRIMIRTMQNDPSIHDQIAAIHAAAVRFYSARHDPQSRAEELYHRLVSGEDPRRLDHLWDESLAPSLLPALEEPLPDRAYPWLERRVLGHAPDDEDPGTWEQEDWEANARQRALSWLTSHKPDRALAVLAENHTRLTPSRLYALEAAAQLGEGLVEAAAAALEQGLAGAADSPDHRITLELTEQAVAVRAAQGDAAGVAAAGLSSASLADLTGEPLRGIRALTSALIALHEMPRPGQVTAHADPVRADLAARFLRLSPDDLRRAPDLVRHVLHTIGAHDPAVLTHAALAAGDWTDAVEPVFSDDSFALARVLDATTEQAAGALSRLAARVGLRKPWKSVELASLLIRTGRLGEALALCLEHAADPGGMRTAIVDHLVLPPHQDLGGIL